MTTEVLEEGRPAIENTPGFLGYVLAVVVSWVLVSGGLGLVTSVSDFEPELLRADIDLEWLIAGTVFWAMMSGFFALGAAPLGVVVVHFACRNVERKWVHVLATALVGGLAVYAVALVFDESPGDWDKVAAGVGFCTAVGRASVIPLVPAVRRGRLATRSVGGPVDNDFRPGRTAC